MHQAAVALTNALAYAQFKTPDIERAAKNLVNELGEELDDEDYEIGTGVEEAITALEKELNDADTSSEKLDAALEEGVAAGNGEEEEPQN